MIKKDKRIGTRIAQLVAIATFAAVLFAALAQTVFQTSRQLQDKRMSLESAAYALASAAGQSVADNNRSGAMAALTAVARMPEILMANIRLKDGTNLATMGQGTLLNDDILLESDTTVEMLFKGTVPVSVDIIKGGEVVGKLVMLGDISGLRYQLFLTVAITFAAAMLAAVMGVAASKPLQRRVVGPLVELTNTMQTVRKSRNYSTALDIESPFDEVGIMVKSFNGLMDDIRFRDNAMQKLAYFDSLTGLPNRISFQKTVQEWLDPKPGQATGAIAIINIDGFRSLNDAFSHSIGDAILMTVAASIKSAVREDVTLARNAGDEFALLFPAAASESDVEMAISRVQSVFFKPIQIDELELHINVTIGALMLDGATQSDVALRQVNLALAEAKKQLNGRVQFYQNSFSDQLHQDTALGQALRQSARAGAFELHYQPQLNLVSKTITGYEALLRWTHPVQGRISPAVFIPLAERIGLVTVIGDWVLNEGCRQAAVWHAQTKSQRIMSINVSLAQIISAGFVEKVRRALQKSGLPPHLLCLELTESIFAGSRYSEVILTLETLAKDGIKLSLDDFGTGYSSLGYLSKMPFHTIKIDRSFVTDAEKSQRKSGMLKSIVEMIHALGMDVVAEGAETQGELGLLEQLNVNKVQGYVVAKPVPAAEAFQISNEIDNAAMAISA